MRILCLNPYLPPPLGGIEKEMLAVSEELVRLNHGVTLLTTTARFPVGVNESVDAVPAGVEVVRVAGHLRSTLRGFAPARPPVFVPGFAAHAVDLQPDLVVVYGVGWAHIVRPTLAALRASARPPAILYRTYYHPPGGVFARLKSAYILRTVARADRAMVATEVERRELIATGFLAAEKLVVVPPGVHVQPGDPELVEELRTRYKLHGRTIVAHVGRLCAFKGTNDLIAVLPRLREQSGRDVVLLLVGAAIEPDGLAAAVARAGVEEHVRIVGEVREDRVLRALLRASHVMALPSEYEAYGIAYIEALAEGVPCIGCRVGGVAESIADAGALLDRFGDRDQLLRELLHLVTNDDLRGQLGARGRERVLTSLTWGHTTRHMLRLAAELGKGDDGAI